MSPPSKPVTTAAAALAKAMDADPVLCSQLKEHLSVERLLDLLDMDPMEVWRVIVKVLPTEDDE